MEVMVIGENSAAKIESDKYGSTLYVRNGTANWSGLNVTNENIDLIIECLSDYKSMTEKTKKHR